MIVCPLSARNEWQIIETNFHDFIIHYFQNNGENIEKIKTRKLKDNLCRSPLELVTLITINDANALVGTALNSSYWK